MRSDLVRAAGILLSLMYAGAIVWVYTQQPQTLSQVAGGVAATVGLYRVDPSNFDEGVKLFRADQFEAARAAFDRADPAHRDAPTQFYIAYSYYRQGWGRLYNNDPLFAKALDAVNRATALADGGRIVVDDPNLAMKSSDELKAELERGRRIEASDFNPLRVFRERK